MRAPVAGKAPTSARPPEECASTLGRCTEIRPKATAPDLALARAERLAHELADDLDEAEAALIRAVGLITFGLDIEKQHNSGAATLPEVQQARALVVSTIGHLRWCVRLKLEESGVIQAVTS